MKEIKCQLCEKKNKSETIYNEFYKCLTCEKYLCPLYISIHDKSHSLINFDKNYKCSKHNEPYSKYCVECKINSCLQCNNEGHKNHTNIFFGDIMPNKDIINKTITELKNNVEAFKKDITNIKLMLDNTVNNLEIFYKINEDIFNNYQSKDRNYELLLNVNQINKNSEVIINQLTDIINDNDIKSKLNKILNINKVMNTKNESKCELIMKYVISKDDKYAIIFGEEFVKRNKYLCKIIHEDKEYELSSKFNVENIKQDILEIKLTGLNYITDVSYMFYNCSTLLSVVNKDNYDFKNVTNMSLIFLGCSLLESISSFEEIDTSNVTNMSFMFSLCSNLDLSSISKWCTDNVTDMSFMFCGCYDDNLENIKLNTKNVINMNGMFMGCLYPSDIEKLNFKNVLNMCQMFRGCSSHLFYKMDYLDFSNVKDISGMFSNVKIFGIYTNYQL